jgi:hypothetical protein
LPVVLVCEVLCLSLTFRALLSKIRVVQMPFRLLAA